MPETNYKAEFSSFCDLIKGVEFHSQFAHAKEAIFESIRDWSQFHSLEEVRCWTKQKRSKSGLVVSPVSLFEMHAWHVDRKAGEITHESGDFFKINGIRVNSNAREVEHSWDQPILTQIGFDGGIVGIIRKRFNGAPHYLCEAKEEPGNYGKVQISPTLQATFGNLRRAHGGRKPHFSEFFENLNSQNVLFDAWLSEDGGRLNRKRNRGVLIEIEEAQELALPSDDFIWLSLFQIKQLMTEDAMVNPHVRGILFHL